MSGGRAPLTALEWLRVTHADTLSGRRIEEAIAAERERVLAPIRALAEELRTETAERARVAGATPCCHAGDRLRAALPPQPTTTEEQR